MPTSLAHRLGQHVSKRHPDWLSRLFEMDERYVDKPTDQPTRPPLTRSVQYCSPCVDAERRRNVTIAGHSTGHSRRRYLKGRFCLELIRAVNQFC